MKSVNFTSTAPLNGSAVSFANILNSLLEKCLFFNNSRYVIGGASISLINSKLNIKNSEFIGN
jgi:hypothetical protein